MTENNITNQEVEEIEYQPVITEEKSNYQNLFNDNWYKLHPDKILGIPYDSMGAFGKIVKYKGDITVLDKIEVPDDFIGNSKIMIDPLASVSEDINITAELLKPEVSKFVDEVINKSFDDIEKQKKSRKKKVDTQTEVTPIGELNSFSDIFKMLNPEISLEEVEVFTWYKSHIGKPVSKNYVKLFKPEMFEGETLEQLRQTYQYEVDEDTIANWVDKGLLCYYNGELIPRFEYQSGNMYDKKTQLKNERDEIVRKYGEQVYESQEIALQEAFNKVYQKRLIVGGENSLVLNANSKFAEEFKIERIVELPEDEKFKILRNSEGRSDNKNYGRPDLIKDIQYGRMYNKTEYDNIPLVDAFGWWLLNKKPLLKEPVTHLEIYRHYIQGSPIKIPHKKDNPADVQRAKVLREKMSISTQKEGERLFKDFLDTQLLANDKIRLETQWNMAFNNYLPVDLDKVPVAFTMAKYIFGQLEEVKKEKRDAVAFTINNGTGILAYDVGVGKANLLTSKILTPTGWVKMGDIKLGDDVIGKDGHATKVIGVFPQGKRQSYKITFSDGSSTEVTDEHLWNVQTINHRSKYKDKWEVVRTMDIKDNLLNYRGDYQYSIPMVEPVHFKPTEIPLDPYVLGLLLGDGYLSESSVLFSNIEQDIIDRVKMLLPESVEVKAKGKKGIDWRISKRHNQKTNEVVNAINKLGLRNKRSQDKFIPECYKFNTPQVRLDVLRGLLDADGYIHNSKGKDGCTVIYTTTSTKLVEDVTFLVQSFGGTVSVKQRQTSYTYKGVKKKGKLSYNVTIRLPYYIVPVTTCKKVAKFKPKSKYNPIRFIKSIEDIGMQEAQCIKVSASDELYVCDDFIVTHNTPSAIYTMSAFMDAGYCKRPLLVVPNQVYRQFINEIKQFTPHINVNEGYNLGKDYIENFKNPEGNISQVPEGSITVVTYEGFENIGFNEQTSDLLTDKFIQILTQGDEKTAKQEQAFRSKVETIIGRGLRGGVYNIEDFGFDFMCYDEAHKLKKVFSEVKGEIEEEGSKSVRGKNPYQITSGTPSSRGLRGFMLNYYILQKNDYKNVMMLTATPFTNSPLEIFSMLSMVAYETLRDSSLDNLKSFFDNYIKTENILVMNASLKPQYKQVAVGFNNLISLQSLIFRFVLYKSGDQIEEIKRKRPKKYVLPYLREIINDVYVDIPEDNRIETFLQMTPSQKSMNDDIIAYVEGKINSLGNVKYSNEGNLDESSKKDEDESAVAEGKGVDVDEESLSESDKKSVRTLKGLNYSRNLALSPYLYENSGLGEPKSAKDYVESSPKLLYVMKCIKSVKDYCISNEQPIAGQVIYMDRGIKYFGLLKEYLINEIGFNENEVGIIVSGLPTKGTLSKDYVKNLFNGEIYNEKTKLMEKVDDFKRLKVIIGSSTIKEGMNLQKKGAVLYNCFIDWNPTDIKQLEGRIFRQGNTYDAVRIVNPLVVDSADIFVFQKLQEKTLRLNTIWSTDGKTNELNTQEFNPEELKYALIKDPYTIADLQIIKEENKLSDDILGVRRQSDIIGRLKKASFETTSRYKRILDDYRRYRDFQESEDKINDFQRLVQACNDLEKKQKDRDGKKMIDWWEKKNLTNEEIEKGNISDLSPYQKPYGFSDFAINTRDLVRYINNFVKQYNINFDINDYDNSLKEFNNKIDEEIKKLEEYKAHLRSEENVNLMVQQAIEEKERQKIKYKSVPELVTAFSKLNYLLDKKKVVESKQVEKYKTCPPMEADGVTYATDEEALKKLKECIDKDPQTKSLHFDPQTGYTIDRVKLHNKIVNDLFKGVKCIREGEQPIAIFTGGSPASGKTFFLNKNAKYLLNENVLKIDADEIRAKLPEYKKWNANSTVQETNDIIDDVLNKLGTEKCRYDFVYDGTMNKSKKYFPLIKKVKELGYKVYILFMEVPYGVARERALSRYREKGRYVPVEIIDDFFTKQGDKTKGQVTLDELKPLVDGYVVADGVTGNVISDGGEMIPDRRSRKVYSTPVLEIEEQKPVVKKATKEEVMIKIKALKFLADMGNKEAENKIKILKLLL